MTTEDIQRAVAAALGQVAPEADLTAINPTQALREQFDLDSMDFLRFVVALDQQLGVDVPEADYPQLRTVESCVGYLFSRLPPLNLEIRP